MIRFDQVNKWYGAYHALVDVTEHIAQGEVVVVCGPSGSGKSTLIRTLNRLEPIGSGTISINGEDIHRRGLDVNAFRSRIGFLFQQFNLFPHLTAIENCTLAPVHLRRLTPAAAREASMALLALTYFVLCFGLSRFAYWLEQRLARRVAHLQPLKATA